MTSAWDIWVVEINITPDQIFRYEALLKNGSYTKRLRADTRWGIKREVKKFITRMEAPEQEDRVIPIAKYTVPAVKTKS